MTTPGGQARRQAALLLVLALVALLSAVPGQASAATYRVTMQGYAFAPATLSVPAGSTVTWTNQDTAPHDVKTTSGPVQIHSPMLNKGESWSFTFTTAGSYAYYCTVHPNMTAGIAVQAAAPATSAVD
jgi:amicyanin